MRPTREQVVAMRRCWRPKLPELDRPCPGCPFETGNDAEFGAVVGVLRRALGVAGRVTKAVIRRARALAFDDIRGRGDFACHHTVYDVATGKPRPEGERRQCAGAARLFRAGEV